MKTKSRFQCSAIFDLSTRTTALVALVDYATIVGIASEGTLKLQAKPTAAMGRHVLSDVVVIFGPEEACRKMSSGRLSGGLEQLRYALVQRPEMFDGRKLSGRVLDGHVVGYERQSTALSLYFLMSLPAAIPDRAVRSDSRVGVSDRD